MWSPQQGSPPQMKPMKRILSVMLGLLIATPLVLAGEHLAKVAFVAGPRFFQEGDKILIKEVLATSPNLAVGDKVVVRGEYRLKSRNTAQLCLFLTDEGGVGPEPVSPTQTMQAKRRSAGFELSSELKHAGALHLSFYSGSRRCGTVYFGTEQQMKKISHWELTD